MIDKNQHMRHTHHSPSPLSLAILIIILFNIIASTTMMISRRGGLQIYVDDDGDDDGDDDDDDDDDDGEDDGHDDQPERLTAVPNQ